MEGLDQLHPAPVVGDRAAEVGVDRVLDPLLVEPLASSTIATQWAPVRFADRDRVGEVVGVAVGDEDVGRVDLVGGHHGGRVVRLQERVDQHPGVAVDQLNRGVAV